MPSPQPLRIFGNYQVDKRPWTNSLPPHALAPQRLAEYWLAMLDAAGVQEAKRRAATKDVDKARTTHDAVLGTAAIQYRYSNKIELKTLFSIVVCLHEMLAPDAPFVCDGDCPHVHAGASAELIKRLLDALDSAMAHANRRARESLGDQVGEDALDERDVFRNWRERFATAVGGISVSAGPEPEAGSPLWRQKGQAVAIWVGDRCVWRAKT